MKIEFLDRFKKKLKHQISCKFVQWETSCSMRTDVQTDITKLVVAFRNFVNALKMSEEQYSSLK
jgi:hypothetical protein